MLVLTRTGDLYARKPLHLLLFPALLSLGCKGSLNLGKGEEPDSRFTADVYVWPCIEKGADTGSEDTLYNGVYAFDLALEYAPDALASQTLPAPGDCQASLSVFPIDAGASGVDIPELSGDPEWESVVDVGVLAHGSPGFYFSNVLENQRSCQTTDDVVGGGVALTNAGAITGARTPDPGRAGRGHRRGRRAETASLDFGEVTEVSWEASGWNETWVQIRQERDGEAWGTVTCNTTGLESFTLDASVWGELSETLPVQYINLYVGFTAANTQLPDEVQKVHARTRTIYVQVIQD
jgi:hypothetical protein